MPSLPPRLIVRHGPQPQKEFVLDMVTSIMGREPINDVVFPDPEVSRRHARIMRQMEEFLIEDLGSTNGTYVNGRRIDVATPLQNGDIIDLGESVRLTFVMEEELEGDGSQPVEPISKPDPVPNIVTAPLREKELPKMQRSEAASVLATAVLPAPTLPEQKERQPSTLLWILMIVVVLVILVSFFMILRSGW